MANLALKTVPAGQVSPAVSEVFPVAITNSITLKASVDITAGQAIRANGNGQWILAQANNAGNATGVYIATRTVKAQQSLTGMRRGRLDGIDIAALAFGASVFLSDTAGALADATGTVTVVLARVIPVTGTPTGDAPNKILEIDCPL